MKKLTIGITIGLVLGLTISGFAAEATQFIAEKAGFPILVNGKAFTADNPPVVIEGRTYLPLRAIGTALGVKVNWNNDLRQVEIGETNAGNASGYGYSNPAPINTLQTLVYEDYSKKYTTEITVKDIVRGDAAWLMIEQANSFNEEPAEGYEYMLAKINFNLLDIDDGKAFDLFKYDFDLISNAGKEYEHVFITTPDPELSTKLYKGSSNEGWAVFEVKKDDATPKIAFGRKYDGTGGLWFKAYK